MADKTPTLKYSLLGMILAGLLLTALLAAATQFKTNGQIISGGQTRKYLLYVPDSYDPDRPAPLVISLHGLVQWPAHQQYLTGWNRLADKYGFLVVYPRGTGFPLRWNTQPGSGSDAAPNPDLVFISGLIDHLTQTYNLDPARIYANGMSNGGGMSDLLACEFSDRIAAIGGVAGAYLYPREDCQPASPLPVIAFHGVADPVVPYFGGSSRDERFDFLPVEEWVRAWAELHGCSELPQITQINHMIRRSSYLDCESGAEVVFYRIEDGGHTWPGGNKIPTWIAGYTNPDINATELMWEFFSRFSLDSR
jgi:polyhydroxybutyrate depolymerase